MQPNVEIIAILGGIGTYLLRFLPMNAGETSRNTDRNGSAHRFLTALGPAAIVALLVVSLGSMVNSGVPFRTTAAIGLALTTVYFVKKLTGSIAFSTLAGAIMYGIAASTMFLD